MRRLGMGVAMATGCVVVGVVVRWWWKREKTLGHETKTREVFDHADASSPTQGHRRLRKAETVLQWRTSRIIVVIEKSIDGHNQMGVLRTAEILGIQHVWIVEADREKSDERTYGKITRTSRQWLSVRTFPSTQECIQAIRAENREIWATDLGQGAECLELSPRFRVPEHGIALIVGKESTGVSEEMLSAADRRVYLPLWGWGDSLNLSVATGMVLQRLLDCTPDAHGDMDEGERHALRQQWYLQLAKTPAQKQEFAQWVTHKAVPFDDLRRPDVYRDESYVSRKIRRKERDARVSKGLLL